MIRSLANVSLINFAVSSNICPLTRATLFHLKCFNRATSDGVNCLTPGYVLANVGYSSLLESSGSLHILKRKKKNRRFDEIAEIKVALFVSYYKVIFEESHIFRGYYQTSCVGNLFSRPSHNLRTIEGEVKYSFWKRYLSGIPKLSKPES